MLPPGLHPMEVKAINKQKFLAELGRLLTFMYEEDRQSALAMYSKMFDDVAEEQLLLQFLVSPTRQAVVLARAYDAKERKLQVHTQSRDDDASYDNTPEGELPPFILAIDDLQQEAAAQGIFEYLSAPPLVDEDQFSLFDGFSSAAMAEPEAVQPVPVTPAAEVPLAIAGIMSDEPLAAVNEKLEAAKERAFALGVSRDIDPFMTLSFMALPVIPTLRITTRGVFDVSQQTYV